MTDPHQHADNTGTAERPRLATAAWYPDPQQPGAYRYWDGTQWTAHTSTPPASDYPPAGAWPTPTGASRPDGFAVASLILGIVGGALLAVIFGFVARRRIRRSAGAHTGNGLATAGIILGFAWMALLAIAVVLGLTGALDHTNTERYASGEEHRLAALVDRVEQGFKDQELDVVCNTLFTAELKEELGGDGCQDVFRTDGVQADIKIKRLEIFGDTARARTSELGEAVTMTFRKVDGVWLVDGFSG